MKRLLRKIRHNQILNKLDLVGANNVLDTSCQDASFLEGLTKKHPNVKIAGIDISKKDIESAKNKLPLGEFFVTNNISIPYKEKSFDVVISSMTLHHMKDSMASIKEMKRVMKNTGKIYLIDIAYQKLFLGFVLNKIKCPEPYHFEKFYSEKEIFETANSLNLKVKQIQRVTIFPAVSVVVPVVVFELKLK